MGYKEELVTGYNEELVTGYEEELVAEEGYWKIWYSN